MVMGGGGDVVNDGDYDGVVGHNDGDDNDDKLLLKVCSGNRLILFHMTNSLPCARSDLAALPYENTMTFNILFNYTF